MPLFSKRQPQPEPGLAGPTAAHDQERRDGLCEHGLLATWFIRYRLEQEIDRAMRYGRPLAILIARPNLLDGERLARTARASAAEAALDSARTTDLVGWASDTSILIILPETDAEMARIAAFRWRDEIWNRGRLINGPKWTISLAHDPAEFATPQPVTTGEAEESAA